MNLKISKSLQSKFLAQIKLTNVVIHLKLVIVKETVLYS
jgi:hypothetical protein